MEEWETEERGKTEGDEEAEARQCEARRAGVCDYAREQRSPSGRAGLRASLPAPHLKPCD